MVFVDIRNNGIENQALKHCGEILKNRLDRGSCGELGGNRPPPALVTFDVQNNVIGGFGVSAELPGLDDFLNEMNRMVGERVKGERESSDNVNVFLSGNQIRPGMARAMLAKYTGTRLKLYVDVRQ